MSRTEHDMLRDLHAAKIKMENGKLELEASITAYRRGMALMKHCQQQLADAEQQVRILEAGELKDFNTAENR